MTRTVCFAALWLVGILTPVSAVRGSRRELNGRGKANDAALPVELLAALETRQKNDKFDPGWENPDTPPLSGMTLGEQWDIIQNSDGTSPENAVCENREYVDVIVIGAGMAGVSAAATLTAADPSLTYRVLESTDRVGGRMRSVNFGVPENSRTVEDGANWVLEFNDNPTLALADATQLVAPVNDYTDFVTYDEAGQPMDPAVVQSAEDRFMQAWMAAEAEADNQWTPDHEQYTDIGVQALLKDQGWEIRPGQEGNLDWTISWFILDWEYAAQDTSLRYFPYYMNVAKHVNDARGFESIPQTHFQQSANPANLRLQTRVAKINYNENIPWQGTNYKVLVSANNTQNGACTDFYAQRVISTVSAGVINSDEIAFNPPLVYPHEQYSPYYMTQYVKIFYQFDNQFWDDHQMIRVVRDEQHRGHCHHWANMNYEGFYEGSNMIRCEIMTEAFDELKDPVTNDLEEATLLKLLDPLRTVYGADVVGTPIDMYYPKLNKDRDFGYGAYANWKVGTHTFTDFAHFFGGIDIVPYCDHNGCNVDGEWTMHLSGSATCFDHAEYTHGAYFSGEKAAKNVLREIGYDIKAEVSPCDVDWVWLK